MLNGLKAYLDNERLRKEESSPINQAMIERNDRAIKNDLDAFKIIINKRVNILLLLDSFIDGVGYYNENTEWVYLKLTYDEWEFLRQIILYRHLSNENEHKIINDLQEQLFKALDLEIPRDLLSNARVNIVEIGKINLEPICWNDKKLQENLKPINNQKPLLFYEDKRCEEYLEALKKEKPILIPMDDEISLKTIVDIYSVGETVIYQNGDRFELGIIKSVCGNDEYFIWYHTGDTAARTHARHLHKIANNYAFHVYRLDTEDNERK